MKTLLKFMASSLLMLSTGAIAQGEKTGTITISGIVPSGESIVVTDDGVELNPLGAGYSNVKVGSILLNSNSAGGFNVGISSANGGNIVQASGGPNQSISYTISVGNLTGSLGDGVTPPSDESMTNISLAADTVLAFTGGADTAPTVGASYEVSVTTPVKNDLNSGDAYSDTLTITISSL
jgi:hypothetical protein